MKSLRFNYFAYGALIVVCLFALIFSIINRGSTVHADSQVAANERLVTIHDRGQEKSLITSRDNLRDIFADEEMLIDEHDIIEPGIDEKLVSNNYQVNIYRARPITIIDGTTAVTVMSAQQTPSRIAKDAGISLHDQDETSLKLSENIVNNGMNLEMSVKRATKVNLVLYGKSETVYTQEKTVGDFLHDKSITLGKDDTTSVAKDSPITPDMKIEIWRNGKQTATVDEPIDFPVQTTEDANQPVGYKKITEPGVVGKKSVTYEIIMKNGVEESRTQIQSVVIDQPTKQVMIVGTKLPTPTNPSEAQALGHQMMLSYGFGEGQWPCLYNLWMRESGWRVNAANPSGAYGIPQALPGSKMGAGWQSDAAVQIQWGLGYIKGRYSTPCGAWNSFLAKGWY